MRRPGVRIPLPPAFALSAAKSEGCHAGVIRRRAIVATSFSRRPKTTAWQARGFPLTIWVCNERLLLCLYPRQRTGSGTALQRYNQQPRISIARAQSWEMSPHIKTQTMEIETAVAFRSEAKARSFERYLKAGSGREFARRHF